MKEWVKKNYHLVIKVGQFIICLYMIAAGVFTGISTHQYLFIFAGALGAIFGWFFWKYIIILTLKLNKML